MGKVLDTDVILIPAVDDLQCSFHRLPLTRAHIEPNTSRGTPQKKDQKLRQEGLALDVRKRQTSCNLSLELMTDVQEKAHLELKERKAANGGSIPQAQKEIPLKLQKLNDNKSNSRRGVRSKTMGYAPGEEKHIARTKAEQPFPNPDRAFTHSNKANFVLCVAMR
jgi:hypothetical protein